MKCMAFNWTCPSFHADHAILFSYEQHTENFMITFSNVSRPQQAAREPLELKQGWHSAVSYIVNFQNLSLE